MSGYKFQFNQEANRKKLDLYLTRPFWEAEYDGLFSEDIVVDIPSAPPGMPQHFDAFDYRQYRHWLRRTVSNPVSVVQEAYGTPDPNVFWAIRDVEADVDWGRRPGRFSSKIFCRVEFHRGKIRYITLSWNPLRFLEAIGAEIPLFKMDLYDARIEARLNRPGAPAHAQAVETALDASPQAVRQRIRSNLEAFCRPGYWDAVSTLAAFAPGYDSKVWFLPPEMQEAYPPELMERVEAWSALSCPDIDFDEAGRYWATDDPQVYFCEYMCAGIVDWIGNQTPGAHYRNRYFYVLRFDELGRIRGCEEVLNPINKFNSIGVSIPTFPYYFK